MILHSLSNILLLLFKQYIIKPSFLSCLSFLPNVATLWLKIFKGVVGTYYRKHVPQCLSSPEVQVRKTEVEALEGMPGKKAGDPDQEPGKLGYVPASTCHSGELSFQSE